MRTGAVTTANADTVGNHSAGEHTRPQGERLTVPATADNCPQLPTSADRRASAWEFGKSRAGKSRTGERRACHLPSAPRQPPRRFWPVACTKAEIDIDALATVRDQLWAEAYTYYFDGKPWWLDSLTLSRAAADQQGERYEEDPWDELIMLWAERFDNVSIGEVLEHCIQKRTDQWTQLDRNRVGRCLRKNGWERFNSGSDGARQWRFRRRSEGL